MKNTIEDIRRNALRLSVSERASLANDLILSLDNDNDLYLGEEFEAEIKRRVSMVKEGNAETQSVEEVFNDIDKRYKS